MATKRMKMSGRAPERCGRFGRVTAGRHARRGNAMIMAVALTVLLAIIGSSFVLMSRLDRQTVRNSSNVVLADAALEAVVAKIQRVLADDVVGTEPFDDLNGNGRCDPGEFDVSKHDVNGNQVYDFCLMLDGLGNSAATSREPYDYPGGNTASSVLGDPWLASIEPMVRTNGGPTVYLWPHVSDLDGTRPANEVYDRAVQLNEGNNFVDADGDGIMDSILVDLPGLTALDGKRVQYAVRIIDNSGMINGNTAWKRGSAASMVNIARTADADSYGEFLHQIDTYRLLRRTGITDTSAFGCATAAHTAIMNGQAFNTSGNFDLDSIAYQEFFLRDFGWFGYFLNPTFVTPGGMPKPFGQDDEFELRNRFCINTTAQTPIEQAMWDAIGIWDASNPMSTMPKKGTSYRILPYTDSDPNVKDPLRLYYVQLTDDVAILDKVEKRSFQHADQRHLLTTSAYSREMRPPTVVAPGSTMADGEWYLNTRNMVEVVAGSGILVNLGGPGPFRKVNINTALNTWFNAATQQEKNAAVLRVAKAFEASGFTLDQGFQFMANLIDYVDMNLDAGGIEEGVPTIIPANSFSYLKANGATATGPTRTILGTEQQLVITEIYHDEDSSPSPSKQVAVEIYNPPYNGNIKLSNTGWAIECKNGTGTSWTVPLGTTTNDAIIYPGQRFIYRRDPSGTFGSTQDPFNAKGNAQIIDGVTAEQGMVFTSNDTDVLLTRAVSDGTNTYTLVADRFNQMSLVVTGTAGQRSAYRGLEVTDPRTAPFAYTRNYFVGGTGNRLGLSKLDTPITQTNPLNRAGEPIFVANRGPEAGTTNMYRVHGLYELGRVLMVGNPLVGDLNAQNLTITEAIAALPREDFTTSQDTILPDGLWTPANGTQQAEPFADTNGNGVFDPYWVNEFAHATGGGGTSMWKWLRVNLATTTNLPAGARDPSVELFNRISFFSRSDDALDSENADGDSNVATGADKLLECRLQGRINVNTAPLAVLKAAVPALTDTIMKDLYSSDPSKYVLTADEVDVISEWYARAIVYMRKQGGAYTSVSNLLERLDAFYNPVDNDTGRNVLDIPDLTTRLSNAVALPGNMPHVLRFGYVLRAIRQKDPIPTKLLPATIGIDDSQERDWVFTRMANLFTVRSDTFTAYILIRTYNSSSGADYTDRRYVALLDRSNVFLPEIAGQNNGGPDTYTDADGSGTFNTGDTILVNGNNNVINGQPVFDADDSGEANIYGQMPYDPDYYDRQYTTPKVVIRQVPDVR